jgi:integrase/recombinase XerC
VRGPGLDAYKALLAIARAQLGAKGLRDVALLRLLHDLGFRRGEAVRIDAVMVDSLKALDPERPIREADC